MVLTKIRTNFENMVPVSTVLMVYKLKVYSSLVLFKRRALLNFTESLYVE